MFPVVVELVVVVDNICATCCIEAATNVEAKVPGLGVAATVPVLVVKSNVIIVAILGLKALVAGVTCVAPGVVAGIVAAVVPLEVAEMAEVAWVAPGVGACSVAAVVPL